MDKVKRDKKSKAEKYLETVEEAVNLFDALDFPPSRIRSILKKTFEDYFNKKIDEEILIEVGSILHNLQWGTWDYDPDIMGITCNLTDQMYNEHKIKNKEEREKLYRELAEAISGNQTLSVSIANDSIKKLKHITQNETMIHALIQKAIEEYLKNK